MQFETVMSFGIISAGALLLLLADLFREKKTASHSPTQAWLMVAVLVLGWYFLIPSAFNPFGSASGLLFFDGFSFILSTIIIAGTILAILLGAGNLSRQGVKSTIDVDILMVLATIGGLVMVAASDLILLFVGFELLSVCVYALSGLAREEKASAEGSLKYFIMGAFSSAFLLYGMVLVYAATGSMAIDEIARLAIPGNLLLYLGLGLMIFGFGFKVSAVPFHFWTPDVYQGAPVSITAYMAVVVKAAAFGAFLRVMMLAFGSYIGDWSNLIWLMSVLTMTVGNLVALRQQSIKRMLAYSSIAHAGYLMIGLLVTPEGSQAALFYLFSYMLMTIAAFGVVLLVTRGSTNQYGSDTLKSFGGVGWSHPFLGIVMVISMLSLAGMPPLAGFMGKFYLFLAAINGGYVGLAIIAALNSVVSLYYYLRVLVVMYFSEAREVNWLAEQAIPMTAKIALILATLGTIYFGLFSGDYLEMTKIALAGIL
jgi:NADH-quinone oxidoreductase subunit N